MKIIKAESAGFCFGVKRAVDTVYKCTETGTDEKIYTYGPIIHNEEVVKDMEKRGVRVIRSEEDLAALKEGTVIIRSHGVEKRVYEELEKKGIHIVDATCPFVKKIHKIVEKHSEQGDRIIIIGNPDHPEVQGIRGWAKSPVSVIRNVEEAESFSCPADQKICIVAQTTFNYNKFKELVEIIEKKSYDVSVLNTICNATKERQTEARSIAETVDAMIISRYSFRHSLFHAVHSSFRYCFFPHAMLLYQSITRFLSFGGAFQPRTFSAQDLSTSELLRTL